MRRAVRWWDGHQVALYLGALVVGAAVGLTVPAVAPTLESATTPVLAVLLFATFLGVPMASLGRAFRDWRFLGTVVIVNFAVVPIVAFGLSRLVADDAGLLAGLLLVLLTPCVDYVVAFTGLAGGARTKLLAATPLLMVLQMLLLPAYLLLFARDLAAQVDPEPFVDAFVTLILIPLVAAAVVQSTARRHPLGRGIETVAAGAMVPLTMLTLAVIVGSQIAAVGGEAVTLARLLPAYVAFAAIMLLVGWGAGRVARLDVPATRAVVFSGVTRNSLVVLPLALALPAGFELAPLAVVTQTLVELIVMVVLVQVVPLVVRGGVAAPR
jgi:ACR3 family arsenite efflux pump ArsB